MPTGNECLTLPNVTFEMRYENKTKPGIIGTFSLTDILLYSQWKIG